MTRERRSCMQHAASYTQKFYLVKWQFAPNYIKTTLFGYIKLISKMEIIVCGGLMRWEFVKSLTNWNEKRKHFKLEFWKFFEDSFYETPNASLFVLSFWNLWLHKIKMNKMRNPFSVKSSCANICTSIKLVSALSQKQFINSKISYLDMTLELLPCATNIYAHEFNIVAVPPIWNFDYISFVIRKYKMFK